MLHWWDQLDQEQQTRYDELRVNLSGGHIRYCPECRDYVLNGDK